jgi:hypothetical protein
MAVGRMIGWIFLFVSGWVFFLTGLAVLVCDCKVLVDTGYWSPISLYELWWELNLSSLNRVWAVTPPFPWNPIFSILSWCWASYVLMVLGLVIFRIKWARGLTLRTLSARSGPVAGLSSRSGPASGPTASPAWSGSNSLRFSAPGDTAFGQRSTVDTACIRMHLDHGTMVRGRVLRGAFAGARIEELDLAGLLALLRECVAEGDEGGAQLIEKYLDGDTPDWRDEIYRPRAPRRPIQLPI